MIRVDRSSGRRSAGRHHQYADDESNLESLMHNGILAMCWLGAGRYRKSFPSTRPRWQAGLSSYHCSSSCLCMFHQRPQPCCLGELQHVIQLVCVHVAASVRRNRELGKHRGLGVGIGLGVPPAAGGCDRECAGVHRLSALHRLAADYSGTEVSGGATHCRVCRPRCAAAPGVADR